MVFETRLGSAKKEQNLKRCTSADSGVSVALNKTFSNRRSTTQSSLEDLEEEQLDFEPEGENELENTYQNQPSPSPSPPPHTYSGQSPVRDYKLKCPDIDSDYSATVDNYSVLDVSSIAHRKYMLPLPKSHAPDGREKEYLPLFYPSPLSAITTIDSSSEEDIDSDPEKFISTNEQTNLSTDQYDQQSSSSEIDKNSSSYSITQEEEDKLLEDSDSEEESPEAKILIKTDLVETCQIGNARITLPTFLTDTPKMCQTKDLKRTKSTAKIKNLEGLKKPKWDLPFKQEQPVTRVLLENIGYISEHEGSIKSTDSSNVSKSSFGNLIVICGKDKIACEEPQANSQRELIPLNQNDKSNFKLPLPPPKRPPTRPKRTVCDSVESGRNLQIKFSTTPSPKTDTYIAPKYNSMSSLSDDSDNCNKDIADKDDTISILASTIEGDAVEDIANSDIPYFDMSLPRDLMNSSRNMNDVEDRVKEWVQNVSSPEIHKNIPTYLGISETTDIPQHYTGTPVETSKLTSVQPRVNFKDIPSLFAGLCYHYYFNGQCTRSYCSKIHSIIIQKLQSKFQKSNPTDLFQAFQFAVRFGVLFKEIYPAFIKAFGFFKMQNELITSIKQFLKLEGFDITVAIQLIVNTLMETDLTFLEAIEMISFNIGFMEYPLLADILLEIITSKFNISENWEVIKRIFRVTGKIPPMAVKKILTRATSVYPLNKELCLDIYNVLIKSNKADLSQVSEEMLVPYRTLLGFRDAVDTAKPHTLTKPNPQELLAAHIDKNLIKEREKYEREVQGTTVRTTTALYHRMPDPEFDRPARSYNYSQSYENRSPGSGDSDERYFMPQLRPNSFPIRIQPAVNVGGINSQVINSSPLVDSIYSSPLGSNTSGSSVGANTALHFQPPSEISEYVPQNIRLDERNNEHDEVDLTPPQPIFGKPRYRSDFSFETSLHNLLPDTLEHVNINEKDVAILNSVIRLQNGPEFLKLLKYYATPPTLQNFITMTIAHLKSCGNSDGTLIGLMKDFEVVYPDYAKNKKIKAVIEVVVLNLLLDMDKRGHWIRAKNLLLFFCDWDSLVSSQIFAIRRITHMGRYIFLAKMLAKAKNFHFCYEILQCPNLKLLESPDEWPHFCIPQIDLECRNAVLKEFFEQGHHCPQSSGIVGLTDLYRRVHKYGPIYGYDVHAHFNPMLISIMNERQTSLLKYFLNDIEVYYKIMDLNVLRAFTILLADQLPQERVFKLYELCCERQIYTRFTGTETGITVRNNMLDVELQLILNYYFYTLSEYKKLPIGNLTIQIKLMEKNTLYPKILQKCVRSITEINDKLKKILRDVFSINVPESRTDQPTLIEIPKEKIINWTQSNQRWFPIYR